MSNDPRMKTRLTRRQFLTLVGGASAGALLASCAPAPTPVPTQAPPTAAPTAAPKPTTAQVATRYKVKSNIEGATANAEFDEMPQYYAMDAGIFKKNGVDFEYVTTSTGAGVATQGIDLLLAKSIDFAEVIFPAGFEPILKGAELVGLGAIETDATYGYWLVGKSDIKDIKDLVGRKYVISSAGGGPDGIGRYVLAKNNVPADKVQFVPLGGSSARTQALLAGQVDAALIQPQQALKILREQPGKFRVISDLMDYPLTWAFDCTPAKNIKENRPMVVAWVKSVLEAKRIFTKDRDTAVNFYLKVNPKANKADIEQVWEFYVKKGVWDPTGGLNRQLFDATVDTYVAAGGLSKKLEWDKVMDTSIVEDAIKELGPA